MSKARSIMQIARQLASVKRYSRDFSFHHESVLEHTGFVAMYAFAVAYELDRHPDTPTDIEYAVLMSKALMHDAEEGAMGDIPRTTKYMSPEITEALKSAEKKVAGLVLGPLGFYHHWLNAKDNSLEGQIVALADLAAVVYQVVNELDTLGNGSYLKVKDEVQGFLKQRLVNKIRPGHILIPFYLELQQILNDGEI